MRVLSSYQLMVIYSAPNGKYVQRNPFRMRFSNQLKQQFLCAKGLISSYLFSPWQGSSKLCFALLIWLNENVPLPLQGRG